MKPVVLWALGPQDWWCSSTLIPGDAAGGAEMALRKAEGCVATRCEPHVHGLPASGAGCACQGHVGPRL